MKTEDFKKPTEIGDDYSSIELLTAEDYEICESVQWFIKSSKSVLGEKCVIIMENSYRGLSHKMQLVLTHRLISYFCYGSYSSTGVQHADDLIEKIIGSIPKDVCDCFEELRPKYIAKKRLKERYSNVVSKKIDEPTVISDGSEVTMYKRTEAKDFPLEVNAKGFTDISKNILDNESYEILVDSLRGLSESMQYTMGMRIMDYFLFGEILPTGVNHVDIMIKDIIPKYPYDRQLFDLFLRKSS